MMQGATRGLAAFIAVGGTLYPVFLHKSCVNLADGLVAKEGHQVNIDAHSMLRCPVLVPLSFCDYAIFGYELFSGFTEGVAG